MAKFITLENLTRFLSNVRNIIPTKTSQLKNDSDFAVKNEIPIKTSQLENDNNYATKSEIPDISNLVEKSELPTKTSELENDSGFITTSEIPTDYAKQSDIPTKTSELTNDSNFLTSIPSEYITNGELNSKNYATNASVNEVRNSIPTKTSELTNDSDFVIRSDMPDVSNLATKDDIPDISNLADRDDIPTKISQLTNDSDFATKSEIPDTSNFVTKEEIPNLDDIDLSEYAKKTDIPDVSNLASKDEIPDISNLANKSEIPTNYVTTDTSQNITGVKSFANGIFAKTYWGEKGSIIAYEDEEGNIDVGNSDDNITIHSSVRPKISVHSEALFDEIACKSDIPTDYAKTSDVPTKVSQLNNDSNFITQTTLDNNYYTAGETDQIAQAVRNDIPTKLSQLEIDSNNQRVSSAEKTAWNNKSDFNGSYNSLTNKPDLSNYLTASGASNITGAKIFTGTNLQVSDTTGSQPVYIYTDANGGFHVNGQWDLIELDGDTETIRLLGYDIATKDDIPDAFDTSNFATKDDIPTDYITTNTEQTITAVKTIEGLNDKEGNDLIKTNGDYNFFNNLSKHLFLQSTRRPWLYIGTPNSYVRKEMAFLDDIHPISSYYISEDSTSPAELWGGTWVELPEDHVLWITSTANANAGTTISAGLPNITGNFELGNHAHANTSASGAFTSDGGDSNKYTGGTSYSERAQTSIDFNANDGASTKGIYGNSTTVQPPAYRVYGWKRIA